MPTHRPSYNRVDYLYISSSIFRHTPRIRRVTRLPLVPTDDRVCPILCALCEVCRPSLGPLKCATSGEVSHDRPLILQSLPVSFSCTSLTLSRPGSLSRDESSGTPFYLFFRSTLSTLLRVSPLVSHEVPFPFVVLSPPTSRPSSCHSRFLVDYSSTPPVTPETPSSRPRSDRSLTPPSYKSDTLCVDSLPLSFPSEEVERFHRDVSKLKDTSPTDSHRHRTSVLSSLSLLCVFSLSVLARLTFSSTLFYGSRYRRIYPSLYFCGVW